MSGANFQISLNGGNALRLNLTGGTSEQIRMVSPASSAFSGKISVDTTEGWNQKITYIPVKGEIVIFSDRCILGGTNYPGIKIGDGLAYVVDLPFFGEDETNRVINIINNHINDVSAHVSAEDRSFWNAKLNYQTDGENLIFTRN